MAKLRRVCLAVAVTCVMVLGVAPHQARAQAGGGAQGGKSTSADVALSDSLKLDNRWVEGEVVTKGVPVYHPFSVEKPGKVDMQVQGSDVDDCSIHIVNSEDLSETYAKAQVQGATSAAPVTSTASVYLERGSYVVKVTGDTPWQKSDGVGTYRLRGSLTPVDNNETEPNNTFDAAQELKSDKVTTGLLSGTDRVEFYKLAVPSGKVATVTYNSSVEYLRDDILEAGTIVTLWDEDCVQIGGENRVHGASPSKPVAHRFEGLKPGAYYVKVEPYGYRPEAVSGTYTIKWSAKPASSK